MVPTIVLEILQQYIALIFCGLIVNYARSEYKCTSLSYPPVFVLALRASQTKYRFPLQMCPVAFLEFVKGGVQCMRKLSIFFCAYADCD